MYLGIEGAFSGPGSKTVIPCAVKGKFSIRIVPDMKPKDVDVLVKKYLNDLWKKRQSPNQFRSVFEGIILADGTRILITDLK